THSLLKFWASSQEVHRVLREGQPLGDHLMERLGESRKELYYAFKDVTSSESILMQLGQESARQSVRDYGNVADNFCKRAADRSNPWPEEEGKKWAKDMREARDNVYSHLANSYRQLDT